VFDSGIVLIFQLRVDERCVALRFKMGMVGESEVAPHLLERACVAP